MFGKAKTVIQGQLVQGLSRRDCSRAIASSLTIGVFPIIGFSTPINTCVGIVFKLNQPVVQAFNWIIGPVKIALIFPFLRLGEYLYAAESFSLSLTEFSARFFSDISGTTAEFAWTFVHAITGWLVCAPVLYLLLCRLANASLSHSTVATDQAVGLGNAER
ncbi:hypothetical protein Caka_0101 [Coraliomargarita akajimensis DSM 45221]|uniref:DUF2062 domain-containing protein n=2 Tax=Coraliomargarita TaxID=442430 RepID=D5EL28_CORAD|nr:hypothetical protein Caka_0101 [Coraliomargarita akajimensis DSM 45221]